MLTKNAKKMLSVVLSIIIALSACLNSCYINAYAEVYYQSKTVQDSYAELHNYVYSFGKKGSGDYYITTLKTTYDNTLNKYSWKINHSETEKTYRLFCQVYPYQSGQWNVLPSEMFSIYLNTEDLSKIKLEYVSYSESFKVESTLGTLSFKCNQIPPAVWKVTEQPNDTNINSAYVANYRLNYFYPEFSEVLKTICNLTFHKLGIGAHISDDGIVSKTPTYKQTGIKTYRCTACGQVIKTESTPKLIKKKNTISVRTKKPSVKYKKLKKKKQTISLKKAIVVSNAQGAVTFKKLSGNKKITVAKNGKMTLKKGLKKGTYKIKIQVTAAGNNEYNPLIKTVTVKIKVK